MTRGETSMYKRFILVIILLYASISLTGCFSSYPQDIMYYRMPNETNTTANTFILEPPDEIEVLCAQFPKINEQKQKIRPDGKVSFEDIGEVVAAGKTPAKLAEDIRAKIVDLYKLNGEYPVDVRITAFQSKVYYVLGQVNDPGPRIYTGRDTVLTAISLADPNPMAWLERVQVIRPSLNENIRPAIFELNYNNMIQHGDASKDVLLQEGDIVFVPPTVLAWVALKIEEVIRPIARAFTGAYIVRRGMNDSNSGYYYNY
jgi:polysaccharide export outer membrane protein